MRDQVLELWLHVIAGACDDGLYAAHASDQALAQRLEAKIVFMHLDRLLTQGARVSRMFWPGTSSAARSEEQRKRQETAAARARFLLKAFALPSNHPIKNRKLRDHFEHFDERIDDWMAGSTTEDYADLNIGPRAQFYSVAQKYQIFRHYDPEAGLIIFGREEFDVRKVAKGLTDIRGRCASQFDALALRQKK